MPRNLPTATIAKDTRSWYSKLAARYETLVQSARATTGSVGADIIGALPSPEQDLLRYQRQPRGDIRWMQDNIVNPVIGAFKDPKGTIAALDSSAREHPLLPLSMLASAAAPIVPEALLGRSISSRLGTANGPHALAEHAIRRAGEIGHDSTQFLNPIKNEFLPPHVRALMHYLGRSGEPLKLNIDPALALAGMSDPTRQGFSSIIPAVAKRQNDNNIRMRTMGGNDPWNTIHNTFFSEIPANSGVAAEMGLTQREAANVVGHAIEARLGRPHLQPNAIHTMQQMLEMDPSLEGRSVQWAPGAFMDLNQDAHTALNNVFYVRNKDGTIQLRDLYKFYNRPGDRVRISFKDRIVPRFRTAVPTELNSIATALGANNIPNFPFIKTNGVANLTHPMSGEWRNFLPRLGRSFLVSNDVAEMTPMLRKRIGASVANDARNTHRILEYYFRELDKKTRALAESNSPFKRLKALN